MTVTISDVARAVMALDDEMRKVEKQQLELASSLYLLMRQQTALSSKYAALKAAMEKIQ